MMTTNINLAEFEPTAEMMERWPEISAKTKVHPTIFSIIYITKLASIPTSEIWTNEDEPTLKPDFSTERLKLILAGNHLCYYQKDRDVLYVRQ